MMSLPWRFRIRGVRAAALALAVAMPLLPACGSRSASTAPAAARDDATLEALLAGLEKRYGDKLNAPRGDARFLHLLVRTAGARRALEIGTSWGYTAIWLARALEATDGALTTIDIDPDRVKAAKANLARAGLADRVTFLTGDAHEIARTLAGPFDFILLDADKGGEIDYLQALLPKLAPGGLIVAHNAVEFQDTLQEYLDAVAKDPELDAVTLTVTKPHGYSVSRKRKR